jgi:hypothetical protein
MRRLAVPLFSLFLATQGAARDVTIGKDDLRTMPGLGFVVPGLDLPALATGAVEISPEAVDPEAGILRRSINRGDSAGFAGLIYDNRDRGHSDLPEALFPALARLRYAPDLTAESLDYGLGGTILLPVPTLGNSSTAITSGSAPRCLPRAAMTYPGEAERAYRTYVSNMIYVYPEHRDHDAVDLFPANWPYMVVSQGSSGSDQPFLRAIAMTMAAFGPETRRRLEETRLMAPTLQMILRQGQAGVRKPEDYLTEAAHPTVFDAENLAADRMILAAAALRPDEIPPMVRLTIVSEDFGLEAGLGRTSERLFTTPSAIARIWRGFSGRRVMTLSAAETKDPNGRALEFHWLVLHGDPGQVRIVPDGGNGSRARIEVDWPTVPRPARQPEVSRIDVAAIAWNGAQFSAPAFVSISFPLHESRRYEPGPDGLPRLVEVDYRADGASYDPILHWSADWRDALIWGDDGRLLGFDRHSGGKVTRVAPDGPYRIVGPPARPRLVAEP